MRKLRQKIKSTVAVAALLISVAGTANATEGWYGQANVGYGFDGQLDGDATATLGPNTASQSFEVSFEDNWMASGAIGYGFDNGFRLETEISYRQNDFEDTSVGDVTAWGALINLIYDFNRGGGWQPYLGLGIGAASVDVDLGLLGQEEHTGLAYQALAGIGFPLSDRLMLDIGYRYFAVPEISTRAVFENIIDDDLIITTDTDYAHHAAIVGLRWQFAAPAPAVVPPPPPPPPPPVAVCPTADFVVYFEWDRSNLNQAALETIDAAVERAKSCNLSAVAVVGHTDTSGSTAYNVGLSERRAGVVRDALVARGIASGVISTAARGETELARATRDGVREPLNRRTAVTISFR